MDGYLNRESPVYCIIDDGDGDDSREQAIFDAVFETMFDGGTVQTLWYTVQKAIHWSTEAETIVTGEGTDKEKTYEYKDGEFHLASESFRSQCIYGKRMLSILLP